MFSDDIIRLAQASPVDIDECLDFAPLDAHLHESWRKNVMPPRHPGVYVFATDEDFSRWRGTSNILYIGSTGDLRRRIARYLSAAEAWPFGLSRGPEYRIAGQAREKGLALGWMVVPNEDDARCLEAHLLGAFEREHGELPPSNRGAGAAVE